MKDMHLGTKYSMYAQENIVNTNKPNQFIYSAKTS